MKACATIRPVASLVITSDSFEFSGSMSSYQWRLGSEYFPQQAVVSLVSADPGVGQTEPYMQALIAWGDAPKQYSSAMNMGVNVTAADWRTEGAAVYSTSLEKSASGLQLTGEPTNNSRMLNFEAVKTDVVDRCDIFLQYLRVANIMGDNLVVDR